MSEPVVVQKSPYAVAVVAGQDYSWCSCGRSAKQPFCDGSHRDTGLRPVKFRAEKTETIWLCGCKHTQSPPRCDGSHQRL